MAAAKPNGTGYRSVASKWSNGNLQFLDASGNVIYTIDAANRKLTLPSGSTLDTSAASLVPGAANFAAIPNNSVGMPAVAHFHYDATVQGGTQAASPIAVAGATLIPNHSYVFGGELFVNTIAAGTGASVALQLEGANDVISAAAISGAPWSTTGKKAIVPVFTSATTILTTAARDLSVVVTAADLTALVFDLFLLYIVTA